LAALIWVLFRLLEKLGLAKASALARIVLSFPGGSAGIVCCSLLMVKPSEIKSVGAKPMVFAYFGRVYGQYPGARFVFYNALKSGDISASFPSPASYPFLTFNRHYHFRRSLDAGEICGVILICCWDLDFKDRIKGNCEFCPQTSRSTGKSKV